MTYRGWRGFSEWKRCGCVPLSRRQSAGPEPDAREVYGLIEGRRFVARRAGQHADWKLSLERRPQLWERAAGVVPGRMAAVEHLCPQDREARPAMGLAVRFDGHSWQLADLDDPVRTTKITACPFCGAHLPELSRRVHEP